MQGQGRYPRSIPGKHTKLVLMSCRYASAIGLLVIVKHGGKCQCMMLSTPDQLSGSCCLLTSIVTEQGIKKPGSSIYFANH